MAPTLWHPVGGPMRWQVLAASALTMALLPWSAATAVAAQPDVLKRSCAAGGGDFARERAVKTCTTTIVTRIVTSRASNTQADSDFVDGRRTFVQANMELEEAFGRTVVRTQRGNGPVSTDEGVEFRTSTTLYAVDCVFGTDTDRGAVTILETVAAAGSLCDQRGWYEAVRRLLSDPASGADRGEVVLVYP